jgi:hypothetical protein
MQYGLQIGKDYVTLLMNHRETDTTFNRFYSRGTGNIDVVGICLLEYGESDQPHIRVRYCTYLRINQTHIYIQASLTMHQFSSCAVLAMISKSVVKKHSNPKSVMATSQNNKNSSSIIKLSPEDIEKINVRYITYIFTPFN